MTATQEASAGRPSTAPALFTVGFSALLTVTFLVYAQNFLIGPTIPLLVLDLGGDAALVGLVVAAYSFPSMVLRPFIGRIADERGIHRTWLAGTVVLAVSTIVYVIPSLITVFLNRFVHGASWAAFNTGGHATLATSAPQARRGQATSVYNLAIGLAQLAFPGIGFLLATAYGFSTVFVIGAVIVLIAAAIIRFGPVPRPPVRGRSGSASGGRAGLIERGAMLPMMFEFLFTSSVPLYFSFLPLFALQYGVPIESLALFFPVYGIVFVICRSLFAPFADRLGRRALLAISVAAATTGLAIGFLATDLSGIILSGSFFAVGAALETPASMALAIDRSDPARAGAAMATYSLGYQLGLGVGAAAFGLAIDRLGFPAPFVLALILQALLAIALASQWRSLPGGRRPATVGT